MLHRIAYAHPMKSSIALLLVSAAIGFATNAEPGPPRLTRLLTANVTAAPGIVIGPLPEGDRVAFPISGGTFTGPRLNGTIMPVGLDFSLTTPDKLFGAEGIAVLQTRDGANILWRARGFQSGKYVYTSITFRTGSEKYAWLDTAVTICMALVSVGDTSTGVALEMFLVIYLLVGKIMLPSPGPNFDIGGLRRCLRDNQAR